MRRMTKPMQDIISATFAMLLLITLPQAAFAHCDTLDGPVIKTALSALKQGDVTPVLKWVSADNEQAIRTAFSHTLQIRALSPEAQQLADQYFFETLVRIHRAGEGAPYNGLKPSASIDPAVVMADQALESGSTEHLVEVLTQAIGQEINERFNHARKSLNEADQSVDQGRKFVADYIRYTHLVEGLHSLVQSGDTHHQAPQSSGLEHPHSR